MLTRYFLVLWTDIWTQKRWYQRSVWCHRFGKSREEHVRRNCIYGSKNAYIKAIDELPNKTNLSTFFSNKSNKIRLQNYLKVEFQKLSQSFPGKELIYSIQRNCEDFKTGINVPSYECYCQEADTVLFYIIHAIRQTGNHTTVIIDAEDTDVIVLSSLVSHVESEVLGIRRKKSSFYYDKSCSPELASIIVQLHVLTGSDSTSGFFGRGKNAVLKNVLKNIEDAKLLLDDLGKSLTMPEAVYKKIILFVLRYVYNDKKSLNIAESHSLVWRRMKKKSAQRLPPDEDTLRGHIQHCNYVIFMNLH